MSEPGDMPPPTPRPVRVQPIEYSPPAGQRPGLVTAIGVMSIVVAGLSILTNLSMGMQGIGMVVLSQMRPPVMTSATVVQSSPAGSAVVVESNGSIGPRGLADPQRKLVLSAMMQARPLSPPRAMQLDALVAQSGMDMFPFEQITPQRVQSSISESGQTTSGGDYFVLGNGRIEVEDDSATFVAGTGTRVQTSSENGRSSRSSTKVSFGSGTVVTSASAPVFPRVTLAPALLSMIESILSFGLAIYLLVIGILVLRGSPRGARWHYIYAWLKIPLAVLAGLAWAWMWGELMSSLPMGTRGAAGTVMTVFGVIIASMGIVYPIGLLLALRSRSVREYYAAAGAFPHP